MTITDDRALGADHAGTEQTHAPMIVRQMRLEAEGVLSIDLADPYGRPLPTWTPGSHVEVRLRSGLLRQYSLCGPRDSRDCYRIAVLREQAGRGGSVEIHDQVRVGDVLEVSRPRDLFRVPDAEGYLLLAGGIGITPIMAIAERAVTDGKPLKLVYGGRTASAMAFVDELRRSLPPDALMVLPEDVAGRPDIPSLLDSLPPRWAVCACGPSAMLEVVEAACVERGLDDRLALERFAGSALEGDESANGPITVELVQSGRTVEVAADQSILDAIKDDAPVLYSCQEGYCGTCEVRVLGGTPDHRDTVLTDEERASNQSIMICVSRCKDGPLRLDL